MTADAEKNVATTHVDRVRDDTTLAEIAQRFKEEEERRPLREVFHAYKAAMFWSILVSMVSLSASAQNVMACGTRDFLNSNPVGQELDRYLAVYS